MNKFFDIHNEQGKTECWKAPISIKEIEFVIKNLHTQKIPDPDGFKGNLSNFIKFI